MENEPTPNPSEVAPIAFEMPPLIDPHACTKQPYSKKDVVTAHRAIMSRKRNRPRCLRYYQCKKCEGSPWHLTHRENRND